jgi:hypothetical protein
VGRERMPVSLVPMGLVSQLRAIQSAET